MLSSEYKKSLKEKFIVDFVKANDRSPELTEINDHLLRVENESLHLDSVGFSSNTVKDVSFREVSSAEKENVARRNIDIDLNTINHKLNRLSTDVASAFQGLDSVCRKNFKNLSRLESRLDNLLILRTENNPFLYGIEEDFVSQSFIDQVNSTADIEANSCTLGRKNLSKLVLDSSNISFKVYSENNILATKTIASLDSLKEDDGNIWQYLVYSRQQTGMVNLAITLDLEEERYVGDLVFSSIMENSNCSYTVLVSRSDSEFFSVGRNSVTLISGVNKVNIGLDSIQKIKIIFHKSASDTKAFNNQFVYFFNLDSIKLYTDKYKNLESVLFAGPYEFYNEEGVLQGFSKVVLDACTVETEGTSVNFFVSSNNLDWKSISTKGVSGSIVSFESETKPLSETFIESTLSAQSLARDPGELFEHDRANEAFLNKGISSDFVSLINLNTIKIKRNVNNIFGNKIYDQDSRWFYDRERNLFITTVEITGTEGIHLDVGNSGLFINNRLFSGVVFIPKGVSIVSVDAKNYLSVTSLLESELELRTQDSLYPYNHKYLIEGYNYGANYTGSRRYSGVENSFGMLLEYLPAEQFNFLNDDFSNFKYFTIETVNGEKFFKVKVNKSFSDWTNELYDIEWICQNDKINKIYVKAILRSLSTDKTPQIQHYSLRAI